MFEAQVLGLLQRYLGKYVYGLDAESLRISVWRGDVELSNLRLKPEALDELNLPITVKSGLLGRLRLKVPWSKLGTEPVVAEFDRLYIVASPRQDDSGSGACPQNVDDAVAAAQAAEQAAKQQRIDTAEDTWLKDVAAQHSSGTDGGGGGSVGRFRALVDTIIGNLELKISNIHIHYEDSTSNPGHTFCIGVLLSEISAHTVGEDWQRKFVTADALLTLRKCLLLKSLAIYFDCDKPLMEPGKRWDLITVSRWDQLMLPANQMGRSSSGGDSSGGSSQAQPQQEQQQQKEQQQKAQQEQEAQAPPMAAWVASGGLFEPPPSQQQQQQQQQQPQPPPPMQQHQFLLCPVDGMLRYVRRGRAARKSEGDAEQEIHLQLVQIGVQVHQLQYQCSQKLLQEFDRYAASAPHRHLRPHCRPNTPAGARLWWRYAISVVQRQQQSYSSRSWQQVRMLAYYQRYVTAYLRYLQQGKQGSGDPTVDKLDSQLDEAVILLFRRMAHAKFKEIKAKAAAAESVRQPAQQQTWVGWLLGTAPKPAAAQQPQLPAGGAAAGGELGQQQAELDTSMGVEEWNKLEDVLAQQAAALSEGHDESPFQVKAVLRVQVSVAAVELQSASGGLLMQASMGGVDSRTVMYPVTQDIAFSVSTFGVTSCHGPFISSGLITTSTKQAATAASALSARVLRNPQDNSADLVLRVAVAPSYVTYNPAAVQDVVGFFSSDETLELSRLQAQAAARTDKLKHMAQLQLQALSQRSKQQKPRMQLLMTLHAPKVAIPDASGGITLIADLGCFTISTNTDAVKSLTPEEAALYECFALRVDHVSAYLLDGQFAWPSNDELLQASGGKLPQATASGAVVPAGAGAAVPSLAAAAAVASAAAGAPAAEPHHQHDGGPISVLQELLGKRARIVPLLYRFGLGMDLQVSTSVHPRYPVVRLAIAASPLQLHLSPYRYQQLMTVLQSAMATPESGAAAAAEANTSGSAAAGSGGTSDKPLWLSEAEHTAKVSILTWEGLTSSVAKWQSHRWVHVWRGRLYVTAHKGDVDTVLTKTYWMAYRVVQLQPKVVGGCDNVVAIVPKGAKLDTVTESTDAVIMRAQDAAGALELRKRLTASANQMAAVAGLLDLDESAELDASVGTTKDVFEELLSHQLLLQMYGSISEVSLLIAGRSPVSWWPPEGGSVAALLQGSSGSGSASGGRSIAAAAAAAAALSGPHTPTAAASGGGGGGGGAGALPPLGPAEPSAGGAGSKDGSGSGGTSALAAAAMQALSASTQGSSGSGSTTAAGGGGASSSSSSTRLLVSLEEEVDLVAIKFQGAQVGVTVSGDGFSTEVAMAALTIDDLLVGARSPGKAHMARSSTVWQPPPPPPQASAQPGAPQRQHSQAGEVPGGAAPSAAEAPAGRKGPPQLSVDTGGGVGGGDDAAFRTIDDDGDGGTDGPEDEEFYDAEEGDASTPRSMRKSSLSGGSGAGPLAHSITISSTTSMPSPFEDSILGGGAVGGGSSHGRQQWGALGGGGSSGAGSIGGLRDLLPSLQDDLSAGLSLSVSGGGGGGGWQHEPLLQAPSFLEAARSFEAARGSNWQQQGPGAAGSGSGSSAAAAAATADDQQQDKDEEEKGELVRLLFARYNPSSTNYTGLDVEVVLRLSTLVFYCNRPTVAALMVFGTDLGAVNTLLAAPADDTQDQAAAAGAADTIPDSATTESDSVSDMQLLRSGGDERTLFKLTLQVTKVELLLNYEGSVGHPLAIGSIDNFLLELAVHPATLQLHTSLGNMVVEYGALAKSNPNRTMLSVRDKQAGSLIDVMFKMHSVEQSFSEPRVPGGVQYMSVVTHLSTVQIVYMNRFLTEFLDYLAGMLAMQAAPKPLPDSAAADADDATQQQTQQLASSSTVQPSVAQLPAAATAQQPAAASSPAAAAPTTTATTTPATAKPVVVLLDVNLEAPVLLLPLTSGSDDLLEVDLGTLQLKNLVVWEMRSEDKDRQKLLVDEMQITLQKVSGCVVADGVRGRNIIREMGGGVSVRVRRPLLADPLPLPPISTAVTVPKLRASLLDTEYALILGILAGNFAEAAQLPPEILWLHSHLLGDAKPAAASGGGAAGGGGSAGSGGSDGVQQQAAGSSSGGSKGSPSSSPTAPAVAAAAAGLAGDDTDTADMKRQVVSDFSCTNASLLGLLCDVITTKVTVSIAQAQLMLWNAQPQGLPPSAVGSVELKNLWVSVSMTQQSNMLLWLSLPSVCARDLRPGVPKEASLVLSTAEIGAGADVGGGALSGTGAVSLPTACPKDRSSSSSMSTSSSSGQQCPGLLPSLLTLQYRAVNSIGPQPAAALQVRLQRPTLVLDVGFIMKVLHFVAPQAGLQGPVPRPYATHEVHLQSAEPYLAPDHLWLSPEYRIVADAPGLREAVYDGRGHALVLPAAVPSIEHVPLIVVGRGVTLRLRNVKIINKAGLAGVLSLAPGARLVAEEGDGVSWHGPEEALRLRNKSGRHILIQASRAEANDDKAPPGPAGSMTIAVHAVGAAVYLIDAHAAAAAAAAASGGTQDMPGVVEATPGTSVPTTPLGSTGGAAGAETGSATGQGGPGDASAVGAAAEAGEAAEASGRVTDDTQSGLLRMLALYLDCGVDMEMQGAKSKIVAQLLGLSVKAQTRLLEDAAASSSAAASTTQQQGAGADSSTSTTSSSSHYHHQQQQQVATSILEPCDVRVTVKADESVQDINVDVSAVQLRMSPDVMQQMLHLQQVVMEPLAVPPASQPLARVDKFVYIWSSHGPAEGCGVGPPYSTAGAGGVDVIGSDKGVTVWRPQPPMGYSLLGDVLAAGHSQPDHQVVAVAINSGYVTYPLGYTRVWESPGISFWRPIAPPGYVPMGCIASPAMPDRKQCVVVAQQAVVSALLSECMMLCTNGNLWCIQNSMGTFEVAAPDAHHPKVPLYDLRSPLGVAPAALTAQPSSSAGSTTTGLGDGGAAGAAPADVHAPSHHLLLKAVGAFTEVPLPPSLIAAKAFAASRAELRAKVASSGQVSSTVEFQRIWWDKHSKHPSMTQVSLWRPVPPPGYVILGDCMVTGMYCPPNNALVLRDTDPTELVDGRPPLLARPMTCVMVWTDGHKRARGDPGYLTLWRPVAPAGYVAMGLLASTGGREPASMSQVRCVRADLATRVDFQPNSPALIFYPYKQRPALAGWIADERAATFVVVSHDGSPQVLEGYRLKEPEQIRREKLEREGLLEESSTGTARALQMSLSVGKTNLLLRNLLRTPILELEASKLNLGLSQEVCGVRRCFAYLTTSLWSYNQNLEVWEPIMEPWQLLLHMDTNPNPQSSAGIAPGSWIRLTSPHGCVHVTLAQAALNSCLDALTDWQAGAEAAADAMAADGGAAGGGSRGAAGVGPAQQGASGKQHGLAAADGLQVYTTFTNTLDSAAYLQLDYGEGRKQVVMLPPHAATPLTQPLPLPPTSHAPLTLSQAPPVRLVIDVLDGQLLSELAGTGSIPELSVQVEVTGRLAKQLSAATEGMVTRSVPVQVSIDPAAQASHSAQQGLVVKPSQHIAWNERFVLALPPELAEQLLMPAPGDNPFAGDALLLKVTVLDGSGERGLGRVLSSSEVPVTFNWLLSQIQALLSMRADAAAAATSATASTGAALQQQQQQQQEGEGSGGSEVVSAATAQASAKAGESAGAKAASKAANAYGIGLQETLQLWRPGSAPTTAAGGASSQQQQKTPHGGQSTDSTAAAVAAATAAAAAAAEGGPPPDVDDDAAAASPIMQLRLKLSLDDSQVSSSWYQHQLMRRRMTQLLGSNRSGGGQMQMLARPSGAAAPSSSQRPLGTDSRRPPAQQQQQQQASAAGMWGGSSSSSGTRNALRLEGSDVWSPFSYTSLRRLAGAPAGAAHSGVVPIRAGPGLVLELAYLGGQYQGRIRSLCQFFNSTDLVLEVALLQDDDTSWTLLPQQQQQQSSSAGGASFSSAAGRLSGSSQQAASAASLSSSSGRVGDVVEEEVFEYERYLPLRGWSPDHLSSLDPRQYCRSRNGSHGTNSFPRVPLPPGWEWEDAWSVEKHPLLDPDGWAYAFDMNQFKWPPQPGAGIKKAHDFVRRRRWVRKRRRVALPASVLDVAAAGDSSTEQPLRRVLGQVQPGGSLPLPQDWRADNKQLQVRPLLLAQQQQQRNRSPSPTGATPDDAPSHAWSYGVSSGQQSVLLTTMEDGASRLLCCPTLGVQKAPDEPESAHGAAGAGSAISPRRAAAAAPACWFTAVCEATELSLQGAVDVLTDWRITAQPPLTLRNDLPVAAHYVLWERPARGGSLVLRQQGRLEGWSSINVYSVDMRQQVCLTFHPEGADWDEPEPVVISDGFLGSTAGVDSTTRQLPTSFSVSYTNSQASRGLKLRIGMQKHIDTELLVSQRLRAAAAKAAAAGASSNAAAAAVLKDSPPDAWRMSYGAALAQGRPLTLSLSVPVWVVNGTQLPIAVGIVPFATPAGGGSSGDSSVPATGDPAGGGGTGGSSSRDAGIGGSSQGVGQLRVMDTEAFSSVTRPSEQVLIMGNSIELLSYPPDAPDGSGSSGRSPLTAELGLGAGGGGNNGVVMQWAAVFSVMGSRWSTPVVLTTMGAAAAQGGAGMPSGGNEAPVTEAVARLPRYDPILIRARCRDGSVYEVTVRLESAGTGLPLATLVRLDPHMVVSNRTGYTLNLLQPEPIWRALGSTPASSTWLLSSSSRPPSGTGAWIASGSASSAAAGAGAAGSSSRGSSALSSRQSGPAPGSSGPSAVQEATVVLRPGALAVPLSWPAGASRRLLVLTLPPRSGGGSSSSSSSSAQQLLQQQVDQLMWSEPFRVCYPATGVMQVLLPLYQLGAPGEPTPVNADSMAAALQVFHKLFQPQQQPHQQPKSSASEAGKPPRAPPGSKLSGSQSPQQQQQQQQDAAAAGGDNAPMLVHVAKQTDAGLLEYLAVAVNVSVEMPAPGCLHLVLQSLGGEPQQCLMNCTPNAISFRQATPRSAWQLLPPFSAASLVLLQPPDVLSGLTGGSISSSSSSSAADPLQLPSCSEVILRDSDPATSGSAVCTFDTDSSGLPTAQAASERASSTGSGGGAGGGSQRGSSADAPAVFPVHGGDKQALAQVLPLLEAVMGPAGPAEVPGAGSVSIGRTQLDRLLRVIPKPATVSMNQLRLAANIAGQDQSQLSPSSSLHISLEVPALDVSLVDGRPQELLLLSMDGLMAEYHAGNSAGTAYTQVLLRLNLAQLDDMQHGSTFPVVLLPADKGVAEDSAADPLLFFTHVSQPSRYRGVLYTPTLVGHIAALRLQVSETLVWRLYSFTQGLAAGGGGGAAAGGGNGGAGSSAAAGGMSGALPAASNSRGRMVQAGSSSNLAAGAGGAGGAGAGAGGVGRGSAAGDVQQVASADLPLQVDLLCLDNVPLILSFKTERTIRPRWANQMWVFNTLGDMLNLEALQLTLPGLELEGIKAQRSALMTYALKQLQAQALAIAFNVFRSYGVLGTATKLLSVGSNITSAITGTSTSALGGASSSTSSGERVGNVGQGLVKGTLTFGGGLLKGVTGIVADPVAGAKQGGVLGFMTGVGKGLVGVPGQIIGGALSAASQVTEGLDASVSKMKEQITGADAAVALRRRLPRCIRGDRILTPFAVGPAIGLALLHNSGVGPLANLVKGAAAPISLAGGSSSGGAGSGSGSGDGVGDAYETHLTLPMGNVAMITNYRLLLLSAPEFAVLEADVLSGRRKHVDAVPAGRLLWQLTWDQLLCVELAYHSQQRSAAPDGVIVHRKYRSEGDDVLVHDVRCNPNSNQAVWLFEAISSARSKYYVDPRREARGWRVTPVIAAEQQSNQEMPDVMPSMDFKRVWQSGPTQQPSYASSSSAAATYGSSSGGAGRAGGGGGGGYAAQSSRPSSSSSCALSIWRPVGPPGYASLGDVAMAGSEPPSGRPVKMYKDVVGAGDAPGSQVGMSPSGLPPLAMPERFQIVYRDSGISTPLTIWRPVPPKGYIELGHVVVPAIEEPPLNIVRVMRADLVKGSHMYNAPVWSGTSSDNMYWQADVWQVDSSCSTFVAVRHDGSGSVRPDPSQAREPRY